MKLCFSALYDWRSSNNYSQKRKTDLFLKQLWLQMRRRWPTSVVADAVFAASTTRPLADGAHVRLRGRRGEKKRTHATRAANRGQFAVLWQNQISASELWNQVQRSASAAELFIPTRLSLCRTIGEARAHTRASLGFISRYRALMQWAVFSPLCCSLKNGRLCHVLKGHCVKSLSIYDLRLSKSLRCCP